MKSFGRLALVMTAVAALALTLASPGAAQAPKPRDQVKLRVSFYANGEHAPFAYGVKQGIYAAEGIDLEILEGRGSGAVVQAIGGGSGERFGFLDAYVMSTYVSKGLPVKMIGNYAQISPIAIVSWADKPIKAPKDLEGKKIAVSPGDFNHLAMQAVMALHGIDKSKVQEVTADSRTKVTTLLVGQVDGSATTYPLATRKLEDLSKGRKAAYMRMADWGVNAPTMGLVIHTKDLGDKSLNCRMVRATTKAWTAAMRDPAGAAKALVEMFPKADKIEIIEGGWRDLIDLVHSPATKNKAPGWMAKEDWNGLLDLMKTQGGISTVRPHEDYYTNEFVECAA